MLNNEQIAQVFSMYLGCDVKQISLGDKVGILTGVSLFTPHWMATIDSGISLSIRKCKLLLTPLSKISDEDAIEVGNIVYLDEDKAYTGIKVLSYFTGDNELFGFGSDISPLMAIEIIELLKRKGYAVPLYFESDHPLNGKTAIELGLAIDKTLSNEAPNP